MWPMWEWSSQFVTKSVWITPFSLTLTRQEIPVLSREVALLTELSVERSEPTQLPPLASALAKDS